MAKPETPATESGLPKDFPQFEEVVAQSNDKVVVNGGEIADWLSLASAIEKQA